MKKSLIYLIALCLSYTAMQAVCKYAEEQREDRGGGCAYCCFNKAWYGLWHFVC